MTTLQETMAEKVRKLLALSKSDNEHEAKLAAQRASELMEKYQISMSQVALDDVKRHKVEGTHYTVKDQRMRLHWISQLACGCAELFDGTILDDVRLHGTSFSFIGYPDDIPAMVSLFEHLYQSWFGIVERDLADAKRHASVPFTPRDTMKFKAGHGLAYAQAIRFRCLRLVVQRKEHVAQASNTGTALILAKDAGLQEFLDNRGVRYVKRKVSFGSASGLAYGRSAGENAPLGGAIDR